MRLRLKIQPSDRLHLVMLLCLIAALAHGVCVQMCSNQISINHHQLNWENQFSAFPWLLHCQNVKICCVGNHFHHRVLALKQANRVCWQSYDSTEMSQTQFWNWLPLIRVNLCEYQSFVQLGTILDLVAVLFSESRNFHICVKYRKFFIKTGQGKFTVKYGWFLWYVWFIFNSVNF